MSKGGRHMKTITYYSGDDFHDEEYEFEVSREDLEEAIFEIFSEEYGVSLESAKNIVEEFDLYDQMEEYFEDQIKDYFEDQAMEEWQQYEEDKREGHPWSESWFH
jgi:hypothetical protein